MCLHGRNACALSKILPILETPGPGPRTTTKQYRPTIKWSQLLELSQQLTFLARAEQQREALLMAESLWGIKRAELIAHPDLPLTDGAQFKRALARRRAGEPLAYILGHWPFYAAVFATSPAALAPRNDTECLVERTLVDTRPRLKLLEIGTGCGVLALSIARQRPGWHITATDTSLAALHLARQNAHRLGLRVALRRGDLFAAIRPATRYDIILSNPPYVAAGEYLARPYLRHEPRQALLSGADGLNHIRLILRQAHAYLSPGGRLILEHGSRQGLAVARLARRYGYVRQFIIYDGAGRRRGLEARIR